MSYEAGFSADDLRIAELFDDGWDIAEIVRRVLGIEASGGARYQKAGREIQAALPRVRRS